MKKRTGRKLNYNKEGARRYQAWSKQFETNPRLRRIYEEESAKMELWLQLAQARQAAGLTQAELAERLGVTQSQVAKMEKRGYESYTLNSLRRYVQALGEGFTLQVIVREAPRQQQAHGRL